MMTLFDIIPPWAILNLPFDASSWRDIKPNIETPNP
jgi:hypothetical protein